MTYYEPDGSLLNGVIQTWNKDGIVSSKVSVTSSPTTIGYGPEVTLNDDPTYFHTDGSEELPNITYNLIYDRLLIYSYTIKSRHVGSDAYLNSWNLTGSNDGEHWEIIDWQNNTDLHGRSITKNYAVRKRGIFRSFSLVMTSESVGNLNFFTFGAFDLFGILNPKKEHNQSCILSPLLYNSIFIFLTFTIMLDNTQ